MACIRVWLSWLASGNGSTNRLELWRLNSEHPQLVIKRAHDPRDAGMKSWRASSRIQNRLQLRTTH